MPIPSREPNQIPGAWYPSPGSVPDRSLEDLEEVTFAARAYGPLTLGAVAPHSPFYTISDRFVTVCTAPNFVIYVSRALFGCAQTPAMDVGIVMPDPQDRPAGTDCEELQMTINKDQVRGRVEEAKGAIKETTGKVVNSPSLEVKGNVEKNLGKVQAKVGDIREDMKKPPK